MIPAPEMWSISGLHFVASITKQPASGLAKQPGTLVTSSSRQKQNLLIGKKHLLSWLNFFLLPEFWVLNSMI